MKTIGKKIKAIYFLAIIAIVSICMAILPLMSTNVKADSDRTLKVVGAHATVVDKTTSSQNFDGDYAVSFKAEFTKSLYEYLTTNYDVVKFGMLIGPADNYDAVTSIDTALANDYVDSCYLGNKESAQYVSFKPGELTFSYEGTREYSEADITANKTTNATKTQALLEQSNQNLTAIPYYIANGEAILVKAEQPVVRSARKLINDEFVLSNLQIAGNLVYSRYVGTFNDEYLGCDYYIEKATGKVYKSLANNELIPFTATDFINAGQLVVAGQDVVPEATDGLVLGQDIMDVLEVGNDYVIAAFDTNYNVRGIKAKVVTRILSTKEDFFNDVTGDGIGDVARANYIFHLDCTKNTSDGNYTTQTVVDGYYILANNIDFEDKTEFVAASGDVRPQLNGPVGGFSATIDGRGFAISNVSVGTASGGLFGMLNGATIKNIAFDGITSNRNDGYPSLLAYRVYNTTFENVYIRAKAITGNHTYVDEAKAFYQILDKYGQSTFTNVIFENQDALVEGNTAKYARVAFADDKTSVYENVNVIGLPTYVKALQHVAAAGNNPAQHKLVLNLPLNTIKSYVAGPGVYELSKTGKAATVYANLIANINVGESKNIQYIEFVEDTVARGYYLDNAAISADAAVVKDYVDSGYWSKVGGSLVWNSLDGELFVVKSNNASNPDDMFFDDSITLEMYKGSEKLDSSKISLRPRQEDLQYINVSRTTVSKKDGFILKGNIDMPIDVIYRDGGKSYELTVIVSLGLDLESLNVFESGEFVVDQTTGKVFKANAKNELVPYDATGYLAGTTEVNYGGVKLTTSNENNEFVIENVADIAKLTGGKQYPFVALTNGTEIKYLVATVATKVIFAYEDFFIDANADETLSADEYIFWQGDTLTKLYNGYYVLGNNVDMQGKSLRACNGDKRPGLGNELLGFQGTFDGRGFAITNLSVDKSAGLFGVLHNATIKNVALDGVKVIGNDDIVTIFAYTTSKTKVENVYVKVNNNNTNVKFYISRVRYFGSIVNPSAFTNVILENTTGLDETNAKFAYNWISHSDTSDSIYTNTNIVGVPSELVYKKHETDTSKYVLTIGLSKAEMTKLGVEAKEYAIGDCATVANQYANLIAGIKLKKEIDIGYINIVEDTKSGYYLDASLLGADSTAANAYANSGYWAKVSDTLIWSSMFDEANFALKSNNQDPTDLMFTESITLDMYYDTIQLAGATFSFSDEYSDLIEINGSIISKKAGAVLTSDVIIPITATYNDAGKTYTIVRNITLALDLTEVAPFESGEFIIEKTTGKLFKANDKNELVVYDATSYAADLKEIYVAGVQATPSADLTKFTLNTDALAGLALDKEFAITVITSNDEARYLVAKAATKVISTLNDFFVDTTDDGVGDIAQANYIFKLTAEGTGNHTTPDVVTGYYVLANNIDGNNTSALAAATGDKRLYIPSSVYFETGFMATLDGRGFAISNVSTTGTSGMFGILNNATFKNIAFVDVITTHNDSGLGIFARNTYRTKFENVYVRTGVTIASDNYTSGLVFGNIDSHADITGTTFTNVIVENTATMVAGNSNKHNRLVFNNKETGTYTNMNLVGLPTNYTYAAHATDTANYMLTLNISKAAMTKLGVEAKEYAIADCPTAVTTAYAGLIKNLETSYSKTTGYIKFAEDTIKGRGYHVDVASLAADATATDVYVGTGYWAKLGDIIAWKTLINEENFTVKSNNTDPTNMTFQDSIELGMYYGNSNLGDVQITVEDEYKDLVEINGNVVSKKAGAALIRDEAIPVTVTYGEYTKTATLTLQLDLSQIKVYEAGEFILDKTTGKVFKANAKNELVAYDATNFTADYTEIYVTGAQTTPTNVAEFTLSATAVANLPIMEDSVITVVYNGGARYLKVKAVTRVFSTLSDFFVDANKDGTVASDEMVQANYIFDLKVTAQSGARVPSIAIDGYYVLANNIDLQSKGALVASSLGDQTVQVWASSGDVGFKGTIDGRGFALMNGNPSSSSGGMFGAFHGATVKNIAFENFTSSRNDGTIVILGYAYASTFENVYIRVETNNGAYNYLGSNGNSLTLVVKDELGASTLKNVIFESVDGLVAGNTNDHARFTFTAASANTAGNYTNTTIIGMPIAFSYKAHTTDTTKQVLSLTISSDMLTKLGVQAGEIALTSCPTAVTNAYGNLISNIETTANIDIAYINFIADEKRTYYLDSDSLTTNTTAVNAYAETGCWTKLGSALVWTSLIDESQITAKSSIEGGRFTDSIDVDMYYGETALGASIALSGAGAEFVEVSGNTITRKATAQVVADTPITATLTCAGFTKTVDLTVLFDIEKVPTFEAGEFVIDKTSGKVYKANANNELKAYDATSYLGGTSSVTIGDVAQTLANTTEFAVNTAGLSTLIEGEKYLIKAGDNYLLAKVVTRVLSTINDFFNDTTGDGIGDVDLANYIFHLECTGSGNHTTTDVITGYYVLANNIDLASNGSFDAAVITGGTSDVRPYLPTYKEVGFMATFDGRGFAISNPSTSRPGGMFGILNGATIKNVAFIGFRSGKNDGTVGYLAYNTYKTTFENVYLTARYHNNGDTSVSTPLAFGLLQSKYGANKFNNVIYENTIAFAAGNTQKFGRFMFGNDIVSGAQQTNSYTNTTVIGLPSYYTYAAHATDTANYVLTLHLPASEMTKLGVEAKEYAIADCPESVTTAYAGLITNLETRFTQTTGYITFVEDTLGRGYYYDNAALSADATVVKAYTDTGCWALSGTSLVWASLA